MASDNIDERVLSSIGIGFYMGAVAMREMLARFVEQGGDPVVANSMRLNWNPNWGVDDEGISEDFYDYVMKEKLR